MSSPLVPLAAALCLALVTVPAHAGPAHRHGVARLDIAIEPGRITFELDTPLDNLIGIERAPRTDAERRRADAMVATLRDAGPLFRIDPTAQCRLQDVELTSAVLGLGPPGAPPAPPAKGEHADLEGRFVFACADATKAAHVEVGLFAAYARLKLIEVQVAGPRGQSKHTLKRPAARVVLAK